MLLDFFVFFFCKQKTAYEMRISDWSSDVCSSDLISLPAPMTDLFVANDKIADVQVRSSRQLYVFGKTSGETSIYATDASGRVVFSTVARVGNNIETIDQMLTLAMPEAKIAANTMNGFVLLTGTVQSPGDAAEAEQLVQAFVGDDTKVLSRLRTATPLRSEEHTSELPSLMRISYAVFCLKKKKKKE